jgi:hypothetical protein
VGGEILASGETLAEEIDRFSVGNPRTVSLKGISEPVDVVTVDWR